MEMMQVQKISDCIIAWLDKTDLLNPKALWFYGQFVFLLWGIWQQGAFCKSKSSDSTSKRLSEVGHISILNPVSTTSIPVSMLHGYRFPQNRRQSHGHWDWDWVEHCCLPNNSAHHLTIVLVKAHYPSVAYPPISWTLPVFGSSFWDSPGVRPILITGKFGYILVPGQSLVSGQKLTANGYSLALKNGSLIASIKPYGQGQQPQVYFEMKTGEQKIEYMNGRFGPFVLPSTSASQYIQVESDGHLRAYQWRESEWKKVSDLLTNYTGACGYPLVCGKYGLCSEGQCSCPKAEGNEAGPYFSQVSKGHPKLGCSENTPVSCKPSDYHSHSLLELKDFDYFNFIPHIENANREKCKEACLKNCSCKAAIHRQPINSSVGYCSLLSEISFSFKRKLDNLHNYSSFSYIKVQKSLPSKRKKEEQNPPMTQTVFGSDGPRKGRKIAIVVSTLGVTLFILFVAAAMFSTRRNKSVFKDDRKGPQKQAMLRFTRFSYDYLSAMTQDFSVKLGEGGFGSVFYGNLPNSTKIAVKRLDDNVHVKKSFLAEVETLGSVHHINLKIIHDVAKGLAYLHDECHHKILHLDVKPQNILLDQNFGARLADFGLSKLIDKNQSQILTTMRGTPGYMAPEWSSATITEKVDVYSFGVVVMEILCGRKNVDRSQTEEEMHLLRLFTKKAGEGKLLELVDKCSEDMQSNGEEVVEMMRMAAWCLQADYTRRPSMWTVLEVLEGARNVEDNLSYDFLNLRAPRSTATPSSKVVGTTTAPLPSILSGPR
ncbi:hypothetical protein PTKIN_Ptkin07bG0022700 [Pterospermum kingtungense]